MAKRRKSKKSRSPAQRAATARMLAANRKRRGARKSVKRKKRARKNPAARRAISRGLHHAYKSTARIGIRTSARYEVQVKRGNAWRTLGAFPEKRSAADYGQLLAGRFPSKTFRVNW